MVMKLYIFTISILALFLIRCTEGSNQTNNNSSPEVSEKAKEPLVLTKADSIEIDSIVVYTSRIDRDRALHEDAKNIYPNINNEKDQINALYMDEKPVRLILGQRTDDLESRDRFYKKDDKVLLYRIQYWKKTDRPEALEMNCYFKEGKLFAAVARGDTLAPGEMPSRIQKGPFLVQDCNLDSLQKVVIEKLALIESHLE